MDKSDEPSDWWFQIVEDDEEPNVDFINIFLDLLEPNFTALGKLGIETSDVLIWLMYGYYLQCAMSFVPQEMERLGKAGISFNIDCFAKNEK